MAEHFDRILPRVLRTIERGNNPRIRTMDRLQEAFGRLRQNQPKRMAELRAMGRDNPRIANLVDFLQNVADEPTFSRPRTRPSNRLPASYTRPSSKHD